MSTATGSLSGDTAAATTEDEAAVRAVIEAYADRFAPATLGESSICTAPSRR